MSESADKSKAQRASDDSDLKAAQSAFEQFLLSSPYVNNHSNNDAGVKLKNTFIEVQESDDFVGSLGYRSSTAPADISDEIMQLARTITRDLPLMATIVEGLDVGEIDQYNFPEFTKTLTSTGAGSSSISPTSPMSATLLTPTLPTLLTTPTLPAPTLAPQSAPTTIIPEDPDMSDESNYTTVMLRNIPNKYTQPTLIGAINARGFAGKYTFFYLPVDYKNHCNMGYAFLNFETHDLAARFMQAFKGYQLPAKSNKVCDTCWARVQGLKANVEHYRNSPVNDLPDPEYRPLLFQNGKEVPFPRPDSALRRNAPASQRRRSPDPWAAQFVPFSRTTTQSSGTPAGFAESSAAVKLFIGGLAVITTDQDIREHFSRFGHVLDATVVIDKKTGQSRGFGFASFADFEAGDRVMAQRQHIINGQSVGVRFYQPGKK